jgi:hypothetical protein
MSKHYELRRSLNRQKLAYLIPSYIWHKKHFCLFFRGCWDHSSTEYADCFFLQCNTGSSIISVIGVKCCYLLVQFVTTNTTLITLCVDVCVCVCYTKQPQPNKWPVQPFFLISFNASYFLLLLSLHKTRQNKKWSNKKRTKDLCNTSREIQTQTKLDQPSRKNGQHQTSETRPQLQTSSEKRSWTPRKRWQSVDAGTSQTT